MKKWILIILLVGCKSASVQVPTAPDGPAKVSEGIVAPEKINEPSLSPPALKNGARYVERTYTLGNREVAVAEYVRGKGLTFVNLHDDENTSVLAASAVVDSLGGSLIQLRHSGKRNIEFRLAGKKYTFDPNRMFTDKGAKASLNRFSSSDDQSLSVVRDFADQVVAGIQSDIIFTLHNNTEDNYSARSYLNEYKTDAADVYLHPQKDPDDFYFVTERLFFDALKVRGYNVILQNNATATDDGSLSVLAGQRHIPYINIEAQHGHLSEQIDMLLVLYELFE